jgi:hypothetical protein
MRFPRLFDSLQEVREPDREVDAFPNELLAPCVGLAAAEPFQFAEEEFEVVGDEPVPEIGVHTGACEALLVDQSTLAHLQAWAAGHSQRYSICRCRPVRKRGLCLVAKQGFQFVAVRRFA